LVQTLIGTFQKKHTTINLSSDNWSAMESNKIEESIDFPKFASNVDFYLYSKKPNFVSIEELRQYPSLKDFQSRYFEEGIKWLEENFSLESENKENGEENQTLKKYRIGEDGINNVEYIIEDYLGQNGVDVLVDISESDLESTSKELENMRGLSEKTEVAKKLQDFVWKYKNGEFYEHF